MSADRLESVVALFPSQDEQEACERSLVTKLLDAQHRVAAGKVTPTIDLLFFKKELSEFDFAVPRPLNEVLDWTVSQLERGIVHVTHPRYFGLFNPCPTFPAQCADRIASIFNAQLASSKTSPVPVEIEAHVIRLLAKQAGLPEGAAGHFTNSGSEANFTALICALTHANDRFANEGTRAFPNTPTFYASRDCHLSWVKIAHEAGLGRMAVRLIATDGTGRLDGSALERRIKADRAEGFVPVMVVATAGTTGAGMIDPLVECSNVARSNGLWYHVDAAWGGALIVSNRLRGVLAGLEQADSITIDAHKWFATTMGCGMFLTRHASLLPSAFGVSTSYMPSYIPDSDPYVTSLQWSRRFLGLRLFLSLSSAGWDGYARHVERAVALAQYACERLEEKAWTIVNDSPLAVICANPPRQEADIERIVARVLASGRAWVSVAAFEGKKVIRICVTNGNTSREDVDAMIDVLEEALQTPSKNP